MPKAKDKGVQDMGADLPTVGAEPPIPDSELPENDLTQPLGQSVIVELPFVREMPPVDFPLHLDAQLTVKQSNALRRLAEALDRQQARLASGKRVVHPTDAVKYLLEQVAAA